MVLLFFSWAVHQVFNVGNLPSLNSSIFGSFTFSVSFHSLKKLDPKFIHCMCFHSHDYIYEMIFTLCYSSVREMSQRKIIFLSKIDANKRLFPSK